MPELLEVEYYRRLADQALHRPITEVRAPDDWFLKGGLTADEVVAVLAGTELVATRRIGKLLLIDTEAGPVLGLRFGMTGRLVVDGRAAMDRLEYGSSRDEPAWDRFGLVFGDGGVLRLSDPRRLGGVLLDPPIDRLGPDAWNATPGQVRAALAGATGPLKARLLDQSRLAGLGNLLTDEVLYRSGLDPARDAGGLGAAELRRLHRQIRSTLDDLFARGGSHTGRLQEARHRGASCPRDGTPLERRTIGGRTTYSCPTHQH